MQLLACFLLSKIAAALSTGTVAIFNKKNYFKREAFE
jgi:hypothetical protein